MRSNGFFPCPRCSFSPPVGARTAARLTGGMIYQPQYMELTMNGDTRFDELRDARAGGEGPGHHEPGHLFAGIPYHQMVEKGYLEDLLSYIDSDPVLRREDLMEAPLNAVLFSGCQNKEAAWNFIRESRFHAENPRLAYERPAGGSLF